MEQVYNTGMKTLTEVQKAYLAGILDGEGYIGVIVNIKSRGAALDVSIAQNDNGLLSWIVKTTGNGNFHKHNNNVGKVRFYTKKAYELLVALYPYLVVKREQVRLALEFQERYSELGTQPHRAYVYDGKDNPRMALGRLYAEKIKAERRKFSRSILKANYDQ